MRHIDEILAHMSHGMNPEIYHSTRFQSSNVEGSSNLQDSEQRSEKEASLDIHSMEFLRQT